jgi:hypothetical protein
MGWLDDLFGRTRIKRSAPDNLFRLSTAEPDIEDKLGVRFAGRVATVLRALEAHRFENVVTEVRNVLGRQSQDLPVTVADATDSLHFRWLLFQSADLTACLTAAHLVEELAQESGFDDALLAALADFGSFALVFSYRHGTFYPFAQTGRQQRDNSREIRTAAMLEKVLPIEANPELWYPLWDPPWDAGRP